MSDSERTVEQTLAFAQYLSWADLLKSSYESVLADEPPSADTEAVRNHQWRSFGLMCYWYASLNVVIEAWDKLQFRDAVVDKLLAHPKDFRTLFRRYRNGVFHFQGSVLEPRITDFLKQGPSNVYWVRALHDELTRFCAEHIERWVSTDAQRSEVRAALESTIHWYPRVEPQQIESLEHTLNLARELLGQSASDDSTHRSDLEQALISGEAILQRGRADWAALRRKILREAGIE